MSSQHDYRTICKNYKDGGWVKTIQGLKIGFAIALLPCTGMAEVKQPQNIWQFIPAASSAIKSLSINDVDNALLTFRSSKENEYIHFYKAKPFKLADGLRISDIELRLSKNRLGMRPMLVFTVLNQCITIAMVKEHYHYLSMSDYPRGHSENEVTSFSTSANINGQKISFSFMVKDPVCLASVVIAGD